MRSDLSLILINDLMMSHGEQKPPLTFDDEGSPGQSSDLEAGCEGGWLGGRTGGGEDLVRSQEEQEQEHHQGEEHLILR